MKDFILVHERFWRSTLPKHSSDTRICFLAMIQMADKHGWVKETPGTLAEFAALPIEAVTAALETLGQPDPQSRTPDADGRRVVPGPDGEGWVVVNYESYRKELAALKQGEAKRKYMKGYMREYRAKNAPRKKEVGALTDVSPVNHVKGKERKEKEVQKSPGRATTDPNFDSFWLAYPRKEGKQDATLEAIEAALERR